MEDFLYSVKIRDHETFTKVGEVLAVQKKWEVDSASKL